MAPYRMGFIKANNDRTGGWQHIYKMLRSGELVICGDTCPKLVRAIPSRIHDPEKKDDIFKQKGDELDDCMDAFRYMLAADDDSAGFGGRPRRGAEPDERPSRAVMTRSRRVRSDCSSNNRLRISMCIPSTELDSK
jgi:hypothetical protein